MKLTGIRLFATAALLSTPFGVIVCNKLNEGKPSNDAQAVKPFEIKPVDTNLKKTIDEKRIVLEKKEREFASELGGWASCDLPNVLMSLYMVSDNKDENLKARDIAFKMVKRHQDFIEVTGNDFSIKKPNEEQLEAFNRVITMAQKGAPLTWSYSTMPLQEISKKIEEYLQKTNPELKGEKLKDEVEHHVEYFKEYQETLKKMRTQRDDLFLSMRDFNKETKKIDEPPYNPIWGLSLEKVQDITIFTLRRAGDK